jgi:hypothetical protein
MAFLIFLAQLESSTLIRSTTGHAAIASSLLLLFLDLSSLDYEPMDSNFSRWARWNSLGLVCFWCGECLGFIEALGVDYRERNQLAVDRRYVDN